ncbi:purine-binding chemotaxis protein CheW [Candidatus Chloroploca sp. M-50]|uniref:Purine-binding chemotaxis protein CheW n=1 Tax=Candidatus Chloroploca mongolica TaxID=2528176 RepID=A0ABS4DF54_9CHLR|nr:chemotaxis protein CheW [Candidatus Chloroploca mongolica]MBP1468057.1 purine-binding chemotaxis protein CheW [Candidatus Chloroploca mongolica]
MNQNEVEVLAEIQEYLVVNLADEHYAIPGIAVREVMRWQTPTSVPGAPAIMPGLISQRGVIFPVIDLRLILGLTLNLATRATRLVLVEHDVTRMALLVDTVVDLVPLTAKSIAPPPAALDAQRVRLLAGVTTLEGATLAVLNLGALVAVLHETL